MENKEEYGSQWERIDINNTERLVLLLVIIVNFAMYTARKVLESGGHSKSQFMEIGRENNR